MESGNPHVHRAEGSYDKYMKVYNEYLGIRLNSANLRSYG
jgi:hypothetical protein